MSELQGLSRGALKRAGSRVRARCVFSLGFAVYLLTAAPYGAEKPVMVFVAGPPAGYLKSSTSAKPASAPMSTVLSNAGDGSDDVDRAR